MVEFLNRFAEQKQKVNITFTINYKTEFGQVLSILGNHSKLGSWQDTKVASMKWHTGDNWKVTIHDLCRDEPLLYKYVIVDYNSKEVVRWEDGQNRICDPAYLNSNDDKNEGASSSSTFDDDLEPENATNLCIEDEWEHFTVTFSIYFPGLSSKEVMRINGGSPKLGDWNKGSGPVTMGPGKPRKWLTGETVVPWELSKVRFTHKTMPQRMVYKYSILNKSDDVVIWEREPSRFLQIVDP